MSSSGCIIQLVLVLVIQDLSGIAAQGYGRPPPTQRPPSGYPGLSDYPAYSDQPDGSSMPVDQQPYSGYPGQPKPDFPDFPDPVDPPQQYPPDFPLPDLYSVSTTTVSPKPTTNSWFPDYPKPKPDYSYPKPGPGYGTDYNYREPNSGGGGGNRYPKYPDPYPKVVPYEGSQKPPGVINYGYKYRYGSAGVPNFPGSPLPPPRVGPPPPPYGVPPPPPPKPAQPLFAFQTLAPKRDPRCYHVAPPRTVDPFSGLNCTVTAAHYFDIADHACKAVPAESLCAPTLNTFTTLAQCESACQPRCEEFGQTACGYNPFPVTGKGFSYDVSRNECREIDFILGCGADGILFPREEDCVDGCVKG